MAAYFPMPDGDPIVDYSAIPNPGVSRTTRLLIAGGSGKAAALLSWLTISWPAHILFSPLWGPIITGILISIGVFHLVNIKMDPFQLAIKEYDDLGLSPEVIGSVIVDNRARLGKLAEWKNSIDDSIVACNIDSIIEETRDIMSGFHDDPTDVQRSRLTLMKCLTQALKIAEQYSILENRGHVDKETFRDVNAGLEQIINALIEQGRRNSENNTMALSVDLEISDQLLKALTNEDK